MAGVFGNAAQRCHEDKPVPVPISNNQSLIKRSVADGNWKLENLAMHFAQVITIDVCS